MPNVSLTQTLRREYESLFNTCTIRPERTQAVEEIIARLHANRTRYQNVSDTLGIRGADSLISAE